LGGSPGPNFAEDSTGSYAKVMVMEFVKAEMAALLPRQAKEVDIISTTALIPKAKGPVLITREMVERKKT